MSMLPLRSSGPDPEDRSSSATSTESRPVLRKISTGYEDASSPSRSPSLDSSDSSTDAEETVVVPPEAFRNKGYATLKLQLLAVPYVCRKCCKVTLARHKRRHAKKPSGTKSKKSSNAPALGDLAPVAPSKSSRKRPAPAPTATEPSMSMPSTYAPFWSQPCHSYTQHGLYPAALQDQSMAYAYNPAAGYVFDPNQPSSSATPGP